MKLEMRGIRKRFGAVAANDGVDLSVEPGELHALLGENGAGKSTLIKILGGLQAPDEGSIVVDGRSVTFASPREAAAAGIGVVHQHFMLVDTLTGRENLRLAHPGWTTPAPGWEVPLDVPVGQLSVGQRQRVEILKALAGGARLLVLDEPTAVLTPQESERLFEALRAMAAAGTSVVFISHKLAEVMALCSRVTVLRQGKTVACQDLAGCTAGQLASLMVGREFVLEGRRPETRVGPPRLELRALATEGLEPVHLTVHQGEIVGVAGVSGSGQRRLAQGVAGLLDGTGEVLLDGQLLTGGVRERMLRGLAYIPEERNGVGAVPTLSVGDNAVLRDAPGLARGGWLSPAVVRERAQRLVEALDVRCPGPDVPAGTLSGGNLQKLIVARELEREPLALIAAQPTRGVDVGAIAAIQRRLLAERDRGLATLLISEDLEELRRLCDRIAVMCGGRVVGVVSGEASLEELGVLMLGGEKGPG